MKTYKIRTNIFRTGLMEEKLPCLVIRATIE